MSRTRFRPDRKLVRRMLVTVFMLGLLYVLFVGVLIALHVSVLLIVIIAGGFFLLQYFASDRIALFAVGGHVVTPEEAPQLHAIIDRLCALADMPKPVVAIADVDMPNAFATGRSQKRALVCATTGIMRRLDNEELEGVLAHELSHVAHRDVAVMTIASFLGVLAGIITRFAFYSEMFGGGRRNDRDNTASLVAIVMFVSGIVYAISFLLIRALSRYRELAADRSGALLTGRPSALASALVKVTGEMGRIPTNDLRRVEPVNAFFFTPALAPGLSLSSLFSTHPSLERRLENLGSIARELGQPV
ncbi:MAG: heat shock protein HtpX [Frankiales bacterium]|jgi:heat shock protein HtpX|nr:heat shock protein HtpX [Frankiales bacterium]MDX6246367.1 heat shock protein HtpX [Frankiales bacterium]